MISRYSQIQQQVQELQKLLTRVGHVQKIFSTSRYLCLQVRFPGKNVCVYLGRGGGAEGLWLSAEIPPSLLRLRDRWLEWWRKKFSSSLLTAVEIDPQDRAIRLSFQKGGEKQEFYLAWIGRSAHFALYEEGRWMSGWEGNFEGDNGFAVFDRVGRKAMAHSGAEAAAPPMKELLAEELKALQSLQVPKQKIRSQRTKLEKIRGDLTRIGQWRLLQEWLATHDASELTELKVFRLEDLKYKFPENLGEWHKRDLLYGQLKRLKLAEELQQRRLAEQESVLERLNQNVTPEENPMRPSGPVWRMVREKKSEPKLEEGDFVVHSFEGFRVAVGRSARGNDQLRKLWAGADDLWLHALHGASSHAVIKTAQGTQASIEQIQTAAGLIAKQSGISAAQIEVVMTLVKHVRGVSGSPGMVTYKKPKTLLCSL